MEAEVMKRRLETAARNIGSLVDQIHQAYHEDKEGSWRECNRGVCRSAEHMLWQCGYDKNFEPIKEG